MGSTGARKHGGAVLNLSCREQRGFNTPPRAPRPEGTASSPQAQEQGLSAELPCARGRRMRPCIFAAPGDAA